MGKLRLAVFDLYSVHIQYISVCSLYNGRFVFLII